MRITLSFILIAGTLGSSVDGTMEKILFIKNALDSRPMWFRNYGSTRGYLKGPSGDQFTNAAFHYLSSRRCIMDKTLIPLLEKALRAIEEPARAATASDVDRVVSKLRSFLSFEDTSKTIDNVDDLLSAVRHTLDAAAPSTERLESADYIHAAIVMLGSMDSTLTNLSREDQIFRESLAKRLLDISMSKGESGASTPSIQPVSEDEITQTSTSAGAESETVPYTANLELFESVHREESVHLEDFVDQEESRHQEEDSQIKERALENLKKAWGSNDRIEYIIFHEALQLIEAMDSDRLSWLAAQRAHMSVGYFTIRRVRDWISCEKPDLIAAFNAIVDDLKEDLESDYRDQIDVSLIAPIQMYNPLLDARPAPEKYQFSVSGGL
jgi:hypothetical protein